MTDNAHDSKSPRRVSVRMWIGAIACAAAVTLWTALPVAAHHSFAAEFDSTREVKVSGEISKVEWQNPHAWIHVNVREVCERPGKENQQGDNGASADSKPEPDWTCKVAAGEKTVEWGFELASPNGLMRQGWTRKSLSEGDRVTVEGWRARDNGPNGSARVVTAADGKRLFAGSSTSPTQ